MEIFRQKAEKLGRRGEWREIMYAKLRDKYGRDPRARMAHPQPAPADDAHDRRLHLLLAKYMVPTSWTVLGAMPMTSSGKIDRKKLPAPSADGMGDGTVAYVAPRTETEAAVAAAYHTVLGLGEDRTVGAFDSFT